MLLFIRFSILIVIIISTREVFLCTRKQIKVLGLRPRAFICFLVFGNPDETLALVFEILLHGLLFKLFRTDVVLPLANTLRVFLVFNTLSFQMRCDNHKLDYLHSQEHSNKDQYETPYVQEAGFLEEHLAVLDTLGIYCLCLTLFEGTPNRRRVCISIFEV